MKNLPHGETLPTPSPLSNRQADSPQWRDHPGRKPSSPVVAAVSNRPAESPPRSGASARRRRFHPRPTQPLLDHFATSFLRTPAKNQPTSPIPTATPHLREPRERRRPAAEILVSNSITRWPAMIPRSSVTLTAAGRSRSLGALHHTLPNPGRGAQSLAASKTSGPLPPRPNPGRGWQRPPPPPQTTDQNPSPVSASYTLTKSLSYPHRSPCTAASTKNRPGASPSILTCSIGVTPFSLNRSP